LGDANGFAFLEHYLENDSTPWRLLTRRMSLFPARALVRDGPPAVRNVSLAAVGSEVHRASLVDPIDSLA
jgi:hypothetical protein